MRISSIFLFVVLGCFFSGAFLACKDLPDKITFTVRFDTKGGKTLQSQTQIVEKGKKVSKPTDPILEDHVFAGWYADATFQKAFDFNSIITADITLYAKWNQTVFTVTFESDGGSAVSSQRLAEGKKIPKPTAIPTRLGYQFVGWYKDVASGKIFNFDTETIAANITIYAGWGVEIPNANFRIKLQVNLSPVFIGNLLIPRRREVTELKSLDVHGNDDITETDRITSLSGIEHFVSLTSLDCSNNSLTELDISKNTSLTDLRCGYNKLKKLNVSKNIALTFLACNNNSLTKLDLSGNTSLSKLYCLNNSLDLLTLPKKAPLAYINCHDNKLTSLDVSQNPSLISLDLSDNSLTSLDVSGNLSLTFLKCSNNSLTSLDMTGMRSAAPTNLSIDAEDGNKNPITELKVHDLLQNHAEIKEAKTIRGSKIAIRTYSAAAASSSYELTCNDYDPNGANGVGSCTQTP